MEDKEIILKLRFLAVLVSIEKQSVDTSNCPFEIAYNLSQLKEHQNRMVTRKIREHKPRRKDQLADDLQNKVKTLQMKLS